MASENKLIKEVQVRDLPALGQVDDAHMLLVEDSTSTYKILASTLMEYVKEHPDISEKFIQETQKGEADGVVPLNSATKITPEFLPFGESEGTIYEGSDGRKLEALINNHTGNTDNPHGVTKEQIGLGKVENKSSAAIRNELTCQNITDALGYIPETDGSYEQSTAYTDNKIAELISGAPETLDTLKEIADALKDNEGAVAAINEAIGKKANQAELDTHTGNSTIHTTQSDKDNLQTALGHTQSPHARTDATKTQRSETNGNLLINDTEIPVYQHPLSGVTAGTYRQITVDSRGHVTSGANTVLPITQGGTGASTPEQALANLGISASADELNQLDGVTATTSEINCLKGIKSSIQTQLNNKAAASHGAHVPASNTSNQGKFLKSDGTQPVYESLTAAEISAALGYVPGTGSNIITAVKGNAETEYQTGEYNITPAKIGLGNVDNTHDNEKSVLSAGKLANTRKIGNATFDGTKDIALNEIGAADETIFDSHVKDTTAHVTASERTKWNAKAENTNMTAATASAAGKAGLVPAPAAGASNRYLRSDGTWQVPPDTNTTYSPSSTTPKANGTAAIGTETAYARGDHVHPAQTNIFGNAGSATKLAASRTIAVAGDMVGSGSFNGSANLTISAKRRGVSVGQSGNTITNPWYKIATSVSTAANDDGRITFHVSRGYGDATTQNGILTAHYRTNTVGTNSSAELVWEYALNNIDTSKFVLAYKATSGTNIIYELWVKCDSPYAGYHFDVISEGNRTGRSYNTWTLSADTWTTGSASEPTSGYTQIASIRGKLKSDTTGNAGTATKWENAKIINGMSVQGDANRYNYGTCSTAAATAAKTVACTGFTLNTGSEIVVKFTVTNTAANPTLNVNSTGAKPVYYRGLAISAGYLAANRTYTFRYNGTQYDLVGDINTDTTYSNMSAATASEAGKAGLVPAPAAGAQTKYLTGGATYQNVDDHTAAFTSADVADGSAAAWTSVTKLASGETHKSIFNKVSTMFKNLRYLYKLIGTTDISNIGDGTITGIVNNYYNKLTNPPCRAVNVTAAEATTIAASGNATITINIPSIEGYSPQMATCKTTNNSLAFVVEMYYYSDRVTVYIHNTHTREISIKPAITVLYIQDPIA